MKPHKHADLIKAWADGAEVQAYDGKEWVDICQPTWGVQYEYRIKPDEPKPPVVRWLWASTDGAFMYFPFLTEQQAQEKGYAVKLEWSRTEFPE